VDGRSGRCYVAYALSAKYGAIAAVDLVTGCVQDIWQGDAGWPMIGVRGLALDVEAQGLYVLDVGGVRRVGIEAEGSKPVKVERAAPVWGILADPAGDRVYAVEGPWRLSGLD